jgi:peptide/nickel transport system permease protein/peptide/nickel transport system substrate-binding protein
MGRSSYRQGWEQRRWSRRRALRIAGLMGGSAAVALGLAACGGGGDEGGPETAREATPAGVNQGNVVTNQAEQIKRGGTIKIGVPAQGLSLDPHLGSGGTHHKYLYPIYDTLIGYDGKATLMPDESLAEKWEIATPTRIVLSLRQGVKFHDGTEFNAELVKWNLDRTLDRANNATARADLINIDRVEVVSPSTVALNLKQPSAGLLTNLGDRGGFMVSRAAVEKLGKEDFALQGVGSGPFKFKEWRQDAYLIYDRNPTYWRKAPHGGVFPYVDTMRFDWFPEATVLAAALETGQVHVIQAPTTQLDVLDANKSLQNSQFVGASVGLVYINHGMAPFDNADFRRALIYAIDRDAYSKAFTNGRQTPAESYVPPASWAYHAVPGAPKFDLARAREFLQKSGLTREQWVFDLNDGGTTTGENVQFLIKAWEPLGVRVNPVNSNTNEGKGRGPKQSGGTGTLALVSGLSGRADPDAYLSLLLTDAGTYNWGLAPCPGSQERIEKARTVYDQEERKKLYFEADEIAIREVYSALPLLVTTTPEYASKQVRGLDQIWGGEGKERYARLWLT